MKESHINQQEPKKKTLDLKPYYIMGLPILVFLSLLVCISLGITALYEYCF